MSWLLLALERLRERPGGARGPRLGAAAGAQLLAGSADMCVMTALLVAGRLAAHAWTARAAPPASSPC